MAVFLVFAEHDSLDRALMFSCARFDAYGESLVPDDERRDQVRVLVGRRGHLVSLILFLGFLSNQFQV